METQAKKAAGPACRPCGDAARPISAVTVAVMVLFAIILIYYLTRWLTKGGKDSFTAQRAQEVYANSRELFERTQGNASYSEYKTAVAGADPVQFTDIRRLWKAGRFTPEEIRRIL